jgi:hypothetical protein
MKPLVLRKRLRFVPRLVLVLGILLALPTLACLGAAIDATVMKKDREAPIVALIMLGFGGVAVVLIVWAAQALLRPHRNRDVRQLARYGDPLALLDEIDRELADVQNVFAIGYPQKIFSLGFSTPELHGPAAVLLTRSWLVYSWGSRGHRMSCHRLAELAVVYRAEAMILNSPVASAVFIDRHNARIEVPGGVGPVTRLLAEVLRRVPWALNRFDPAMERAWQENREQIIADVDRRREGSEHPAPPGREQPNRNIRHPESGP